MVAEWYLCPILMPDLRVLRPPTVPDPPDPRPWSVRVETLVTGYVFLPVDVLMALCGGDSHN